MNKLGIYIFSGTLFLWVVLSHFFRSLWLQPYVAPVVYGLMLLSLLLFVFTNLKGLAQWLKKKTAHFSLSLIFSSLAVLGVLGLVNWFATENNIKGDFTRSNIHSLSSQTKKILANLSDEISLELWSSNLSSMSATRDLKRFFDSLKNESRGKLSLKILNPLSSPVLAREAKLTRDNVLIFKTSKGKEYRIDNFNDAQAEEQIVQALIQVQNAERKKVCFIQGHSEPQLSDDSAEGFSAFKNELDSSQYEVEAVNLITGDLSSCHAAVLAGPQNPPAVGDVEKISKFLNESGTLLFLAGASVQNQWFAFLNKYALNVSQAVVIDPRIEQIPLGVLSLDFELSEEIVASFKDPVLMTEARAFSLPTQAAESYKISRLLSSDASSFYKKVSLDNLKSLKRDSGDPMGPHVLGLVVHHEKVSSQTQSTEPVEKEGAQDKILRGEVVLLGSHNMARNYMFDQGANKDLLLNSLNYLLKDEALIGIRPKEIGKAKLQLTENNLYQVRGFLILIALAFTCLGVFASVRRWVAL